MNTVRKAAAKGRPALAGGLALVVALAAGFAPRDDSGPLKAAKAFFAAIEKGDTPSLRECAFPETIDHIEWLEGGWASRAARRREAQPFICGNSMGTELNLVERLWQWLAQPFICGNSMGTGRTDLPPIEDEKWAALGGDEEAGYVMCRKGLAARGGVASMKDAVRTVFSLPGKVGHYAVSGSAAPAGATDATTFAAVAVRFGNGDTEKICLFQDEDDGGKWKVSARMSELWTCYVAHRGEEGYAAERAEARHDVYVALDGKWLVKNRARQKLGAELTHAASIKGFFVHNGDVYVAGEGYKDKERKRRAKLQINDKVQWLTRSPGAIEAEAKSVFVSDDGDVYVAGQENSKEYGDRATLWKNGRATHLDDGHSDAKWVFVSEGDVYVFGSGPFGYPLMWKNGTLAQHPLGGDHHEGHRNGSVSAHTSIHEPFLVSGRDVYAVGFTNDSGGYGGGHATLWKNGERRRLSDETSQANAIFLDGGDVYVAGWAGSDDEPRATLWKNGKAQRLSDAKSKATSVAVMDGDVYVAGWGCMDRHSWLQNEAWLWKNGVGQRLGKKFSEADAVRAVRRRPPKAAPDTH